MSSSRTRRADPRAGKGRRAGNSTHLSGKQEVWIYPRLPYVEFLPCSLFKKAIFHIVTPFLKSQPQQVLFHATLLSHSASCTVHRSPRRRCKHQSRTTIYLLRRRHRRKNQNKGRERCVRPSTTIAMRRPYLRTGIQHNNIYFEVPDTWYLVLCTAPSLTPGALVAF